MEMWTYAKYYFAAPCDALNFYQKNALSRRELFLFIPAYLRNDSRIITIIWYLRRLLFFFPLHIGASSPTAIIVAVFNGKYP